MARTTDRARPTPGIRIGAPADTGGESGFGIVEAIVAIVVLSVGLLGLAGLTLAAGRQADISSSRTARQLAAEQVLERLRDQGYDGLADETGAGPSDTTVSVAGRTLTVTTEVTQEAPGLRRIRVEVPESGRSPGSTVYETRIGGS